jgi:hypothetical protein
VVVFERFSGGKTDDDDAASDACVLLQMCLSKDHRTLCECVLLLLAAAAVASSYAAVSTAAAYDAVVSCGCCATPASTPALNPSVNPSFTLVGTATPSNSTPNAEIFSYPVSGWDPCSSVVFFMLCHTK